MIDVLDASGTVRTLDPTTATKQEAIITGLAAILAKIIPTPATELKQNDTITALNSILSELRDDISLSETVWTDDTNTYFVRQAIVNQDTAVITYAYILPNGTTYTPTGNIRLAGLEKDRETIQANFVANTNGTGYNTNDIISRVDIIDVTASPWVNLAQIWFNRTQQTTITAPTAGHLNANPTQDIAGNVAVTNQITGFGLESTQLLIKGVLDLLKTNSDTLNGKDFATLTKQNEIITAVQNLLSSVYDEDTPHVSGAKGQLILAIRNDTDTPTANDGDYTVLKLDEYGRLKVASTPASYADVTGDITAIQATIGTPVAGGTVIADVSRASNVMMFCTGTFAGINCTFEGSLESTGENWFAIQAVRSNANTIELTTTALSAAPAYAWELSVNALARVRVRATARTSGTQSWRFKLGTYATEPIPASQVSATQPVSGTVTVTSTTANIGTNGMSAFADSVANLGISATFTGTSRDGGATQAFARFVARAMSDQAGTFRIEQSADNTNWRRATADIAVAANTVTELTVFATARYHRVIYINGGVAQTIFIINSAYLRI